MDPEREILAQRLADLLLAGMTAIERDEPKQSGDVSDLPEHIPDDLWPRIVELVREGWATRHERGRH